MGYFKAQVSRDEFKAFLKPFSVVCKGDDEIQATIDNNGITVIRFGEEKVSAVKAVLDLPNDERTEPMTVRIPMKRVADSLGAFGSSICIEITDDSMSISDMDGTYEYSRVFRLNGSDGTVQKMPVFEGMEIRLTPDDVNRICSTCVAEVVRFEWSDGAVKVLSGDDLTGAFYKMGADGDERGHVTVASEYLTGMLKAVPSWSVRLRLDQDKPLTVLYTLNKVSGEMILAPRIEEEDR